MKTGEVEKSELNSFKIIKMTAVIWWLILYSYGVQYVFKDAFLDFYLDFFSENLRAVNDEHG